MITSRAATWWSRTTRGALNTPKIAPVRLFSAVKQQSTKQTSEDLPANLILSDSRILQPEQPFNYVKADKLPASTFCINVLEGPFTGAKSADKISPVSKIFLSEEIFRADVRPDVMARIVRWQRNNAMQGTHKAKTKGEVSGTGKKPYKQKGTGLARQGSLRNPQFRGGGAVFGPTPRDHGHDINKKERRLGLRSALAARLQEGRLIVIDNLNPREEDKPDSNSEPQAPSATGATETESPEEGEAFVKTRQMTDYFKKLGVKTAVIVDAEQKETLVRACRNARQIHYLPQVGLNVYAILKNKHLVLTVDALRMLEDRLSETKQRERRYMKRGWTEEDAKLKEQRDQESGNKLSGRIAFRRALFRKAIQERDTVLPVDHQEGA